MEILNQFGFDIKLFIAQIVNFLIIAFVFKKFLYKPILQTLKKREETIKKGLEDAKLASEALENAQTRQDDILQKASLEAEKILAEAREQAKVSHDAIIEDTHKEVEKMLNQAHSQIESDRENFKKEVRNVSLEVSRKILEETIVGLFDKKEQESLITKGVKKIKNNE